MWYRLEEKMPEDGKNITLILKNAKSVQCKCTKVGNVVEFVNSNGSGEIINKENIVYWKEIKQAKKINVCNACRKRW